VTPPDTAVSAGLEVAFTPGEWLRSGRTVYALDESGTCNRFSAHVMPGFKLNYGPHCERIEDEEAEANARLIEAAPDLYEAAEQALELLEQIQDEEGHSPSVSIPAHALRAALSRAGKSS
jgi:hypothetical protein